MILSGFPVVEGKWSWIPNTTVSAQANGADQASVTFLAILSLLQALAVPLTVRGSSDSTTAGLDSVNRLTDKTKIICNGAGVHSWIVLRLPTGCEICFDWNVTVASPWLVTVVFSFGAGFTGGSTSARPTATDEVVQISSATDWLVNNNALRMHVHAMQNADGSDTRVVVMSKGVICALWIFSTASDAVSGWTSPRITFVGRLGAAPVGVASSDGSSRDSFLSRNPGRIYGRSGGTNMAMQGVWPCCGANSDGNVPSLANWTNTRERMFATGSIRFFCMPVWLMNFNASPKGIHGRIADLWRGGAGFPSGSVLREGTNAPLVSFGGWIFPWSTTAPLPKVM